MYNEKTKNLTVKKCPSCGANIEGLQGKCPYCGSTFEGMKAGSSMEKLAKAIEKATRECKERYANAVVEMEKAKAQSNRKASIWDENHVYDDTDEVVAGIIRNFPVPNTKTDLIEFILALKPKTQGFDADEVKDAYFAKYKECLGKARYLFPDDGDIVHLLEANEQKGLKKMFPSGRIMVYWLIGIVGIMLLFGILALLFL